MEIAKTILRQLGGNRFVVMTGSKNFVASDNGLTMKLTRNKAKAKWLKITLNGKDLYDMDFVSNDKDYNIITKVKYEDIYFDQLQEIFTQATGLYTRL
jgi:hypothetical protein